MTPLNVLDFLQQSAGHSLSPPPVLAALPQILPPTVDPAEALLADGMGAQPLAWDPTPLLTAPPVPASILHPPPAVASFGVIAPPQTLPSPPVAQALDRPLRAASSSTAKRPRRPAAPAAKRLPPAGDARSGLSKRAQRVIRTREAAARNRMEQRAKLVRLKETNARLDDEAAALALEGARLRRQLALAQALQTDVDLRRRVLAALADPGRRAKEESMLAPGA